jgi:2-polyprenyl-6-methoxyphenol hydroxylase-like FAD-dependent oxidoreductase
MTEVETVVVGGGPSGAATACHLAAAGREVLLLERSGGPHHKVCGEFLSVETQAMIRSLGIDPLAIGAIPIDRVSIHVCGRQRTAALPFHALSLSRLRLDDALLASAEKAGVQISRGTVVQGVRRVGDRWWVRCDNGSSVSARNLVLATGKHGLRGISDQRDGSLVGLKMHLRLRSSELLKRRVELFLLDRSYVGMELVEDGVVNLCLVMARELAGEIGPGWPALRDRLVDVSPALAARLEGSEPLFDRPLAVVCPANDHLDEDMAPRVYRVGDRLAHVPPFTGDGLAIALTSGTLAARYIADDQTPAEYRAAAGAMIQRPIRLAGMLSRLAANRAGRTLILGAATLVPGVVTGVARRTRLPALPMPEQDVSYAAFRA